MITSVRCRKPLVLAFPFYSFFIWLLYFFVLYSSFFFVSFVCHFFFYEHMLGRLACRTSFCANSFLHFVLIFGGFPMTLISFTSPMSFLLCLIILFSSLLLWGCLFNLTSAWLGLHLAYLLGSSPLLSFVAPLMALGFLASLVALPPWPFHFCKRF
jgi:hypothetical protein